MPGGRTLADYVPADPSAWRFTPDDLDPAFAAALASGDEAALDAVAREVHPGIWRLTPVRPAWAVALREEVRRLHAWARRFGVPLEPPNTMNQYGVVTDTLGLDLAPLREALRPLAGRLFPAHGGATVDHHHAFVVRYAEGEDLDLGFHADDAEVTLNLCLGDGFLGGDLYFEGERCAGHRQSPSSPAERFPWAHQPGVALLHAGANRHGARPLRAGERHNLILWLRSAEARARDDGSCPDWCAAAMSAGPRR